MDTRASRQGRKGNPLDLVFLPFIQSPLQLLYDPPAPFITCYMEMLKQAHPAFVFQLVAWHVRIHMHYSCLALHARTQ